MIEFILVGIIAVILCGIIYYKKDTIIPWMKRNKKKAGAIITAAIAGSSMASAGLFGVPSLELDIDDYLIEDLSDYEALGINVDKIVNPIVYEEQVLCEGHLPLAFKFSRLSKSVTADSSFISASKVQLSSMQDVELEYKILVNETYTAKEPVYETIINKNGTSYREFKGYKDVSDYRYVWRDLSERSIKQGDIVIINIIGRFKARTIKQGVDIVPTLSIDSSSDVKYSKTYSEYAWWNNDWTYKKEIQVDHTQVPDTLQYYPMLLNITDTDLRDNAQSDGDDIAFTDSTESTQLYHEIEYWDNTTGQLVAWINTSSLDSSANTTLYMYYGNAAASNQEDMDNTWCAEYKLVCHGNRTGDDLWDSSGNGHHPDTMTGDPTNTSGDEGFGYYQDYDGDDWFDTSNTWNARSGAFTVSAWITHDVNTWQTICTDYNSPNGNHFTLETMNDNGGETRFGVDDGADFDLYDGSTVISGWSHVAGSSDDNGVVEIYYDGEDDGGGSSSFNDYDSDGEFSIASRSNGDKYWDGYIDELRWCNSELNASWINTEYNNFNNATSGGFFTVYSEEVGASTFEIQGLTNNNITFYGYQGNTVWCNSSGTGNETMRLYQDLNNTQEVTGHDIYVENMTDGSNWFSAANITLYASSDNTSFGVPSDDDGNGNGVFIDGGSVITLNTSTWNAGTMGSDPYTIENLTSDTIYVRFKADIPGSLSIDTTYFSSNDTSTWAMPFYVNFTGNDGV